MGNEDDRKSLSEPTLQEQALQGQEALRLKKYPGRFLAVGVTSNGELLRVNQIAGRSSGSRNRRFEEVENPDGTTSIKTAYANPQESAGDPALTIYEAMSTSIDHRRFFVSNGAQTRAMADSDSPEEALTQWNYEPDPASTSRISAWTELEEDGPSLHFSIIRKKDPTNPESTEVERTSYHYSGESVVPGVGYYLSTYDGEGGTGPFQGGPIPIPLEGTTQEIVSNLWENVLDKDTSVAITGEGFDPVTNSVNRETINRF